MGITVPTVCPHVIKKIKSDSKCKKYIKTQREIYTCLSYIKFYTNISG